MHLKYFLLVVISIYRYINLYCFVVQWKFNERAYNLHFNLITSNFLFSDGKAVPIALFYPENSTLDLHSYGCLPIRWKSGRAPKDKYTILIRQENIHPTAFFSISCICGLGVILASTFLFFNLYHRKLKYVRIILYCLRVSLWIHVRRRFCLHGWRFFPREEMCRYFAWFPI